MEAVDDMWALKETCREAFEWSVSVFVPRCVNLVTLHHDALMVHTARRHIALMCSGTV